jgi:hypothetical protein
MFAGMLTPALQVACVACQLDAQRTVPVLRACLVVHESAIMAANAVNAAAFQVAAAAAAVAPVDYTRWPSHRRMLHAEASAL